MLVVLDGTTKSIVLKQIADIQFTAAWADSTSSSLTEGSSHGASSGSGDVTVVGSPATGVRRVVKSLTMHNGGVVTRTIVLAFKHGSDERIFARVTLGAGATWYSDEPALVGSGAGVTDGDKGDIIVSDAGTVWTIDSSAVTTGKINDGAVTPAKLSSVAQVLAFKNRIINGSMMIAQRGTSFTSTGGANNDDVYTLDRWTILSDGNDTIDVTQATDVPTGGLFSIGLDVETVNRKFGIIQFIEQRNCVGLIGNTVTLSFKARVSSTTKLDNVKCAILAFSGTTADSLTSDVVSSWNNEGTNPTLIANWTYENTPANLNVTTSWATYSVSAAVDTSGTKNVAVFIWSDVADTTLGDFLYITDVQLERGSTATEFEVLPIQTQLDLCYRYHQQTGPNLAQNSVLTTIGRDVTGLGQLLHGFPFKVEMRAIPTLSTSAAGTDYRIAAVDNTGAIVNITTNTNLPVLSAISTTSIGQVNITSSVAVTAGAITQIRAETSAAFLGFSSEL